MGGMFFGGLFWLFVFAVFVFIVLRASGSLGGAGVTRQSPLNILEERYAKGEIQREEYLEKRKDLEA